MSIRGELVGILELPPDIDLEGRNATVVSSPISPVPTTE
jgi:hypothetical protein